MRGILRLTLSEIGSRQDPQRKNIHKKKKDNTCLGVRSKFTCTRKDTGCFILHRIFRKSSRSSEHIFRIRLTTGIPQNPTNLKTF